MYGPVSKLELPYEIRHRLRFKDKYQRPLTEKEKDIIEKVKAKSPIVDGVRAPNIRVLNEFGLR